MLLTRSRCRCTTPAAPRLRWRGHMSRRRLPQSYAMLSPVRSMKIPRDDCEPNTAGIVLEGVQCQASAMLAVFMSRKRRIPTVRTPMHSCSWIQSG